MHLFIPSVPRSWLLIPVLIGKTGWASFVLALIMYQHRVHLEFGRLYFNGHAKGLLGTLNQPAWSRLCVLETIWDGFLPAVSGLPLLWGMKPEADQRAIWGENEWARDPELTPSDRGRWRLDEAGELGQLVCLEGSLSLALLFTKLPPSLLSVNFPICKRSIVMVPTSWSSCGHSKRSFK